ncbi:hypothetical protein KAR91_68415 [Candidatus Pacearchaeota archaeon]|nr:hypothetical protein [Candidatus Pacearchaeota archaeon]
MIVKKPIGAVKINNLVNRLTVGKLVPANVLKYWKETNQYEALKKAGIIGEPEKQENKKQESSKTNDSFRSTENR